MRIKETTLKAIYKRSGEAEGLLNGLGGQSGIYRRLIV